MSEICPQCGKTLAVGDWPYCRGNPAKHVPAFPVVVADEVPGGFWQHNGFREPRKFYSKSERDRALAEAGWEIRVRHVPVPGTDRSPHTTDWARGSVDLEGAAALVSRRGKPAKETRPIEEPIPITVTDGGTFTFEADR